MLVWYLVFLFGFIFTKGEFSLSGIFLLLLSFLLLFIKLISQDFIKDLNIDPRLILLIFCALSIVVYGGFYQTDYVLVSYILLSTSVISSFILLLSKKSSIIKKCLFYLFFIAITTRLLMIWGSPNPKIDVFDILKFGAQGLLRGINPYSNTYTPMYDGIAPNYYSYPPGSLLLSLPSVLVSNDPRYALIIAEIIVALLIYKLVKNKQNKYVYSLIFLYNPLSQTVLEESFTEPLLLALLAVAMWFILKRKVVFSAVIFGLLLGTKQYSFLLFPLFIKLFPISKEKMVSVGVALITLVVIVIPFYLWNSNDFFNDVVLAIFNQHAIQRDSLTFGSFLSHLGISLNLAIYTITIFVLLLFAYLSKNINPSRFFYLSAFIVFAFFFFNRWAALNYYYFIGQLVFLGFVFEKQNKNNG